MVVTSLKKQTDANWSQAYEVTGVEENENRFSIYLRIAAHFHHHIGQMIYLVKAQQTA